MADPEKPADSPDSPDSPDSKRSRVRSHVFVSYSHDDKGEEWYTDVQQYLEQLTTDGEISIWDDNELQAGDDWQEKIEEKLTSAIAAVFLVTPTFVTSEFITKEEVPRVLERHESEGMIVHALLAKPADWEAHPIGEFLRTRQLAHSPDRPLEEMEGPERRKCLNELVKQIRKQVGICRGRNRATRRDQYMDAIEQLLDVQLLGEVAGGDTSIVYKARQGVHYVAVKAMVSRRISDVGQDEINGELSKCQDLQSPAFIRIHDVKFDDGYCILTADWVPGRSLKESVPRLRAAARRNDKPWPDIVTEIVLRIAEALAEGNKRKLRYLSVSPSSILMQRDRPRMYPIDSAFWLANAARLRGTLSFRIETLDHLAPEYFKPAERDAVVLSREADEETTLDATASANQYALGMLALTLLDRRPVETRALEDVEKLLRFHEDPRGFLVDGERLEDRAWRRESPALARVIWRMLSQDPEDRWENMDVVCFQLRAAMDSASDGPAHVSQAKSSYSARLRGNSDFYKRFYDRLIGSSSDVKAMFEGVDLTRQSVLLEAAIERMLNFRKSQEEPTTLSEIVIRHRHLPLSAEHFELFGKAFLATLGETPGIDVAALDAWETVLWPGIEYLKAQSGAEQ